MSSAKESGRDRFLRAIAELVPVERVAEVHLFPPMLQGGQETGVAVIAAYPVAALAAATIKSESDAASGFPLPAERLEDSSTASTDAGVPPESQESENLPTLHHQSSAPAVLPPLERLIVYRACYRWTRKGPDRGRWEVEVTEEADAPLGAVGNVVRGVYRRAGSGSEPERLSAHAFRAVVSDEQWTNGR